LHDYMKDLLEREEIRQSFIHTDQAFMVDGWVLKQDIQKLKDEITSKYDEIEIRASDPTDEDEPPIYLQNRGLASPFRMVTGLYGLPAYRGIDPSPLFAPFFIVSLALTISDAGYGLVVALLGYFLSKRSKGSSKDLFRIFIIAGCTAILIGLFTGGWFGIKADKLPSLLRKFQLYDPMSTAGQLIFMGIVIGIGFIQVWFGNFIKMRLYIKDRDWAGAFLEQFPWLLAMVIAPIAGYLYVTKVSPGLTTMVIWIIIICLIVMTLFSGRSIKNPVGRLAQGLFDLYGRLSGLLGDTLSYMRLFALGLSGVIFAGVVNTMAGIIWGNPIGKIAVIGLLIGGHGFSVLMGCLGGFIHTTRLQFVEFFTKFYESGGREFRPFKSEYSYIAVDMKKSTKK